MLWAAVPNLGLPNLEERLAKAQLAYAISRVINERGLTQRAVAALMGIDQPRVSHKLRGRLPDFSTPERTAMAVDRH